MPDGRSRTIVFADGTRLTFDSYLVRGRMPGVVAQCIVRLASSGQEIISVGEKDSSTEAFNCGRLNEVGALPNFAGRHRLGLIYVAEISNHSSRLPIVLSEAANGEWKVDYDVSDNLDDGVDTLAKMIAALRAGG